jgi:hypothetical protein
LALLSAFAAGSPVGFDAGELAGWDSAGGVAFGAGAEAGKSADACCGAPDFSVSDMLVCFYVNGTHRGRLLSPKRPKTREATGL